MKLLRSYATFTIGGVIFPAAGQQGHRNQPCTHGMESRDMQEQGALLFMGQCTECMSSLEVVLKVEGF